MKNLKKILIVVCVCAFLVVGCAVAAFAADEYTGTLADFEALITATESAADPVSKYNAVMAMSDYLVNTPIDPATEGYADALDKADAAIVGAAELLLGKIDANIEANASKTVENKLAINRLNSVLTYCKLNGDKASLETVEAGLADLVAAHERAVDANLAILEDNNNLLDYDLPQYFAESWEKSQVGYGVAIFNKEYWSIDYKRTVDLFGVAQEENGNKYFTHIYTDGSESDPPYIQLQTSKLGMDSTSGVVFEFDIATFSNVPEKGVHIETGSVAPGKFPKNILQITAAGDLATFDGDTLVKNALSRGEWLHIIIVFRPEDFMFHYYVEGIFVGSQDARVRSPLEVYDFSKINFRISGEKGNSTGDLSLDNFSIYSGNHYRNPDRFKTMSSDELFVYYADLIVDETKDVNSKNLAYDLAGDLLDKYWTYTDAETGAGNYTEYAKDNKALTDAVDAYLGFDFSELLAAVKLENLSVYSNLIKDLDNISRATSTVVERKEKVYEIETFLTKYEGLIDTEADLNENGVSDSVEYYDNITAVNREIVYDENAIVFIRYINRFSMVTTITAMQRYYDRANALITDGSIDMNVINNSDHEDRATLDDLVKAYEIYSESYSIIYAKRMQENSSKIVTCMGFINGYTTEAEWLEHYDEMNRYINIVKSSILETDEAGNLLYDANYEGIDEALNFFHTVYEFFYNVQQERHIEYISEILTLIYNTEAYVEKMGMVSMIDRYVASNDLNYEDSRIISLLNSLETTRSELQVREEDYAKILVQNAVYFVNVVENMRTASTYTEKKNYFEEASILYFNIDVTVEGAADAVVIYDEYAIELEVIEESSLGFIAALDHYNSCEDADERYAALVACYRSAQFAEPSYAGVSDALEEFETEYDLYMNYVEAVNEEIVAAGNAVGSLRTNCGITPIIAIIIKKIYGV